MGVCEFMRLYNTGKKRHANSAKRSAFLTMCALLMLCASDALHAASYDNAYWSWVNVPSGTLTLSDTENKFNITAYGNGSAISVRDGVSVSVTATSGSNLAVNPAVLNQANWWGIYVNEGSTFELSAAENNHIKGLGLKNFGVGTWAKGSITLSADQNNQIEACFSGVFAGCNDWSTDSKTVTLTAGKDNIISSSSTTAQNDGKIHAYALQAERPNAAITVHSIAGNNRLSVDAEDVSYGAVASYGGKIDMLADKGSNIVTVQSDAVRVTYSFINKTEVTVKARRDNILTAENTSGDTRAVSNLNGTLKITAEEGDNQITSNSDYQSSGVFTRYKNLANYDGDAGDTAITALKGNNIIKAESPSISWGVFSGEDASVEISAPEGNNEITSSYYGLYGYNLGKISVVTEKGTNTIVGTSAAAVFSEEGASVDISAPEGNNEITSSYYGLYGVNLGKISVVTEKGTNVIEGTNAGAVVSANGATVQIDGQSKITGSVALLSDGEYTDNSGTSPAAAAASMTINYDGSSSIAGSVIACNNAIIDIAPRDTSAFSEKKMAVSGDLIASWQDPIQDPTTSDEIAAEPATYVGGTVSVDLNDGSLFTGKALTALDLGTDHNTEREGIINLNLAGSALWNMTGSSSVTRLSGTGTVHYNSGGNALQVVNLSGSHTFEMDLSTTGSNSDMLYVMNSTGDRQFLKIKNFTQLNSEMDPGSAVRFAVFRNGHDEFRDGTVAGTYANGVYNDTLTIRTRNIDDDPDNNETYNQ